MPIHAVLDPGLEAYRRAAYAEALVAWEEPWLALAGEERGLALALVRLAGALLHQSDGRTEEAEHLYRAAGRTLADLPAEVLGVDVGRLVSALPDRVADALAAPPAVTPAAPRPRWVVGRFVVLVLFLATALAVVRWTPVSQYLTREALTAFLGGLREIWWAPLAFIGIYVVFCPLGIPVSPLILAGGIVFGSGFGSLYNIVGNLLGAAATFFVGRHLGRDFVVHLFGRRLARVEKLLTRHGFWALVRIRFIPIPFPVVNYGAALAGIKASVFLSANVVGLTPAIVIYTWFASALFEATGPSRGRVALQLAGALLAILLLTFLPTSIRRIRRRRRYRELLELRRRRRL